MITRAQTPFAILLFILATTSALSAAAAPSTQPTVVEVDQKTKVHLLGISTYPPTDDSWFALNGDPIDAPDARVTAAHVHAQPAPEYQIAFKIEKPASTAVRLHVEGATVAANQISSDETGEMIFVSAFALETPSKTAKVRLGFATSDWKTLAASDRPAEPLQADGGNDVGPILFQPIEPGEDGARVTFEHAEFEDPHRYVVIDDQDKEHEAGKIQVRSDGQTASTTCTFDVPADKVKKVLLQTRKFTKVLEVSDISLEKGRTTQPKIEVQEVK